MKGLLILKKRSLVKLKIELSMFIRHTNLSVVQVIVTINLRILGEYVLNSFPENAHLADACIPWSIACSAAAKNGRRNRIYEANIK